MKITSLMIIVGAIGIALMTLTIIIVSMTNSKENFIAPPSPKKVCDTDMCQRYFMNAIYGKLYLTDDIPTTIKTTDVSMCKDCPYMEYISSGGRKGTINKESGKKLECQVYGFWNKETEPECIDTTTLAFD